MYLCTPEAPGSIPCEVESFFGSVLEVRGTLSLVRTIDKLHSYFNRVATSAGITSVKRLLKYGN
jgi:hypothetical protein